MKRVRLVQQVPLAYLEVHQCSHHIQECQESKGPKEKKVTLVTLVPWDHRAILENWALGDPPDLRVPRDILVHMGLLAQLETLVLRDLQDPLVSVAPQEVWVPLVSEVPLGKMGSAGKREQRGRKAAPGQLVHGAILVLLASLGHLEKGQTGSQDFVDHLGYLVP